MSDVTPRDPDYELDEEVDGTSPEAMKALAEPVRSLILDLVLERAMSVTELAARSGKAKGTIAHHVDVLVGAGLLKVVRMRRVRAVEERFYGRVARTICFQPSAPGLPFFADAEREADLERIKGDDATLFTLRHVRIPSERAGEFAERLMALAIEFTRLPRHGDTEYALLLALFPTTRRVARHRRGAVA